MKPSGSLALLHQVDPSGLLCVRRIDTFLRRQDALSFELFYKVNHKETTHELWESIKHTFSDSSTWDDGKFKKEDKPKDEVVHECVEHDHNLVIVEDCSTSWSSDDNDEKHTTSSLNMVDDDATSHANDDATPCTLVDDGSCSGYESDASTSSPSPPCFMSQGDTKV